MATVVQHFDALVDRGLKPIPLRPNSKIPLYKGWQKSWNRIKYRGRLKRTPDANLGLLLGDVVDVEGDSRAANDFILNLIGDYEHPCYQSTKSIHHLFRNPDPQLRILCTENIEFRGHGHQSVLPPSWHEGVEYQWLSIEPFPVPEMPPALRQFYYKKSGKKMPNGMRWVWCSLCGKKQYIHRSRFKLELAGFRSFDLSWQCHKCRQIDMRPICRSLRYKV